MAMGNTGTVNMTVQMFQDMIQAVDDYKATTDGLKETLDGLVNGLVGSDFVGAAADGWKSFYVANIQPANGEGLDKLMQAIKDIAEAAKNAIPGGDGLDDQLGQGNSGGQ